MCVIDRKGKSEFNAAPWPWKYLFFNFRERYVYPSPKVQPILFRRFNHENS